MRKLKLLFLAAALTGSVGMMGQTDVTSTYITNAGFESSTASTVNTAGGDNTTTGIDYTDTGWKIQTCSKWCSSAIVSYGGSGQVNGTSAPSADNEGNTGNALGISVGWDGTQSYRSANAVTLPAGKYELEYYAYNNNTLNTEANKVNPPFNRFTSLVGFIPTTGTEQKSSKSTWTVGTWEKDAITFTLTTATEGKFQIGGKAVNGGSGQNAKLFFDNFKLTYTPFATSDDYTALNAAISTVEGKAWGFDAGEYAPYNYVEILEALASAKAVNQTDNNLQPDIQALTNTLNGAVWTANDFEVNAIFDGSFQHDYSGLTGNVQPLGWYRVEGTTGDGYNVRYVTSSSNGNAGMAYLSSDCGLFTKMNAYYGWADGYTMPLNATTYYTLKFSAGGSGDCEDRTDNVQITDPTNTTTTIKTFEVKNTTANSDATSSSWSDISTIFQTGTAGNYVLGLIPRNNKSKTQNQFLTNGKVTDPTLLEGRDPMYGVCNSNYHK